MGLKIGHVNPVGVIGRVQDGTYSDSTASVRAAMSKMGAGIMQDQIMQWAIDGRTFHAQQGDASTRVAWVVTAYDEDRPQFALRVPSGKTAIMLSMDITVEIQAGTFTHHIWSTTTNDIGAGTSTALTVSATRRDAPFASGCSAQGIYTANATAATGLIERARWVDPFVLAAAGAPRKLSWNIRSAASPIVLVGPATLQMHTHATSSDAEGYVEAEWAEMDTLALATL